MVKKHQAVDHTSQEDGLGDPKLQAPDLSASNRIPIEESKKRGLAESKITRSGFATCTPIEPLPVYRHHAAHLRGQLMIRNAMARMSIDRCALAELESR
jgi:hypothetical protein